MRIIYFIFLLTFLSGCTSSEGNGKIFHAGSDKDYVVSGESERTEDVLWLIDSAENGDTPMLTLKGTWGFNDLQSIRLELLNGNAIENIQVLCSIYSDTSKVPIEVATSQLTVKAGDIKVWEIPLFFGPVDTALLSKMIGMRATAFTLDNVNSNLRSDNIQKITVSFSKGFKGAKLGIRSIGVTKAEKIKTPEWFAYSETQFFPFIDKYGQFIHKDWPGKTKTDQDLKTALLEELAYMKTSAGPKDRSLFGGWKDGARQQATGVFQLKKLDGKWWMVDPEGYLFWSNAIVRVTPSSAVTILDKREDYFAALPTVGDAGAEFYKTKDDFLYNYYASWDVKQTFDFSAANIGIKYGSDWRNAYADMLFKRFENWGVNTISAGSDRLIYQKNKVPYCDRIELQSPKISGAPTRFNVIRDPYDPSFVHSFAKQLVDRGEELSSPWCYGYFVDNKIQWGNEEDLGSWVLQSPSKQPAKVVFIDYLKTKYGTVQQLNTAWKSNYKTWESLSQSVVKPGKGAKADCIHFSSQLITAYFAKLSETIKRVATGKLYLGCRYVSFNPLVLRLAAKYSDVLTFDLFWDDLAEFKLPAGIDKPVLIGEFHFGALDRGLFNSGLNHKRNQQERANAYERYMLTALQHPNIIGTSWHQLSDQATTGRFDGENFQDGLTDVCDLPYWETVEKVKSVGTKLYQLRSTSNSIL